jgi:hypothetical protein
MIPILNNAHLQGAINRAWQEIENDPQHRLHVAMRLELYDLLIGDLGISMRQLTTSRMRFPKVTPGLKRYWYLGLQTVSPLLALWNYEVDCWLAGQIDDYSPYRSFPAVMLEATTDLLRGIPYTEVDTQLTQKTEYWLGMNGWHYVVGNLSDDLPPIAGKCLWAIYAVYLAVRGLPPVRTEFPDDAYDDNINQYAQDDFTACAVATMRRLTDRPLPIAENLPYPLHGGPQQLRDFWRWWLFELLPQAAVIKPEALDWQITHLEFAKLPTDPAR